MVAERRIPEASGLRQLFHEQWAHFLQLFEDWNVQRQDARQQDVVVSEAIETVVDGTDVRIRGIGSYKKRLRQSVRTLLEHVENLVDDLPAAISVNQKSFATEPLVNSFFVNKDEIKRFIGCSRELQEFFQSEEIKGLDEAYALLFVNKEEKTILGKSLKGDVLMGDVKQTAVSFSGHHVFAPCPSEEMARKALKHCLFNSIVDHVRMQMTHLRREQMENAGKKKSIVPLKNPEVYLEALLTKLSAPRELLKLHQDTLRISKMGIKISAGTKMAANEIAFNEVEVGAMPTRIITIIKYPRAEMVSADAVFCELGRTL